MKLLLMKHFPASCNFLLLMMASYLMTLFRLPRNEVVKMIVDYRWKERVEAYLKGVIP
jgi:hypothetical protein